MSQTEIAENVENVQRNGGRMGFPPKGGRPAHPLLNSTTMVSAMWEMRGICWEIQIEANI